MAFFWPFSQCALWIHTVQEDVFQVAFVCVRYVQKMAVCVRANSKPDVYM